MGGIREARNSQTDAMQFRWGPAPSVFCAPSQPGQESSGTQNPPSGYLLLTWINRADLARVKGIGEEYADLLEMAGVDTVPELAQRSPANLHKKIEEVAAEKVNDVRRVPSESEVAKWVA
jgi:hypothetical protein